MKEIDVGGDISAIISSMTGYFGDSSDTWFRGQGTYAHSLLPQIFRQGKAFKCQLDEASMCEEFMRRYPEQSFSHKTIYDWLTLMQHYGIPTRLLDWTTNLLVALYFCCTRGEGSDGALFAFNPRVLGTVSFTPLLEKQILSRDVRDYYDKLIFKMGDVLDDDCLVNDIPIREIKKDQLLRTKFIHSAANIIASPSIKWRVPPLRAIDPLGRPLSDLYSDITGHLSSVVLFRCSHLNPRIRQQHGCFTFHGGKYFEGAEFVKVAKIEEHPYVDMVKARIASSDKGPLLRELRLSGISAPFIFPEMEHQAEDIREKYSKVLV